MIITRRKKIVCKLRDEYGRNKYNNFLHLKKYPNSQQKLKFEPCQNLFHENGILLSLKVSVITVTLRD